MATSSTVLPVELWCEMNAESGRLLTTCLLSEMQLCQLIDLQMMYMQKVTMELQRRGLLMPPEESMTTELRILRDEANCLHRRLEKRAKRLENLF